MNQEKKSFANGETRMCPQESPLGFSQIESTSQISAEKLVRRTYFIKVAAQDSGHCSDGSDHCKNGHGQIAIAYRPPTEAPTAAIARIENLSATLVPPMY